MGGCVVSTSSVMKSGSADALRRDDLARGLVLAHDEIFRRETRDRPARLGNDRDERGLLLLRRRSGQRRYQGHRQQGRADQTKSHATLLVK